MQTPNRFFQFSVPFLTAVLLGACSDSPTVTSSSALSPSAVAADPAAFTPAPIHCQAFEEVRARVRVDGSELVINYAVDGVPRGGYYYLRFWLQGRHIGEPVDFEIGELEAHDGQSGEFRLAVQPVATETTYDFNIQLEGVRTREDYESGTGDIVQCDRGGSITLTPPAPDQCEPKLTVGEPRIRLDERGGARIDVPIEARAFRGTASLVEHSFVPRVLDVEEVRKGCGATARFELRGELRFGGRSLVFVEFRDENGDVVEQVPLALR